jgi:hypothetical protein
MHKSAGMLPPSEYCSWEQGVRLEYVALNLEIIVPGFVVAQNYREP